MPKCAVKGMMPQLRMQSRPNKSLARFAIYLPTSRCCAGPWHCTNSRPYSEHVGTNSAEGSGKLGM